MRKKGCGLRSTGDFRQLNSATMASLWIMLNIVTIEKFISGSKHYNLFDFKMYFWQNIVL